MIPVMRAAAVEWRRVWSTRRWIWLLVMCLALVAPTADVLGPFAQNVHATPNAWDLMLYQFVSRIAYPFGPVLGYCLWLGALFDADVTHHYRWYLMMHAPGGRPWLYLVARAIVIGVTTCVAIFAAAALWFLIGWALYGISGTWSSFARAHSIYWPTRALLHLSPFVVSLEAMAWAAAGVAAVGAGRQCDHPLDGSSLDAAGLECGSGRHRRLGVSGGGIPALEHPGAGHVDHASTGLPGSGQPARHPGTPGELVVNHVPVPLGGRQRRRGLAPAWQSTGLVTPRISR